MTTTAQLSPRDNELLKALPIALDQASGDAKLVTERFETAPGLTVENLATTLSAKPNAAATAVVDIASVLSMTARATRSTFQLLQNWEGVVVSLDEDSFAVTLQDLTDLDNPPESAELFLDDVAPGDMPLVKPGAVFYWSVGYEDTPRGREKKSFIHFRRLPAWSQRDIEKAEREGALLGEYFAAQSTSSTG